MEKVYNKLVRDNIPEIIMNDGEYPVIRVLNDEEYKKELERKLLEEYKEVIEATDRENRLEELADMLEVMRSLANIEGASLEEVMTIMKAKKSKRGGFARKIFLEKAIKKDDNQ